ncbi:MAG: hypothetical protein ACXADD_19350 [Candidatus Thorarchaeota archaeon]|jgi:hypothetical protein
MRQTKVLSNIVVITVFCIFMITIVPICTIDKIDLVTELSTEEISPEALPLEREAVQALDEMMIQSQTESSFLEEQSRTWNPTMMTLGVTITTPTHGQTCRQQPTRHPRIGIR